MAYQTRAQAVDWWERQQEVRNRLRRMPTKTLQQSVDKVLCSCRLNRLAGARYREYWGIKRKGDEEILNGKS